MSRTTTPRSRPSTPAPREGKILRSNFEPQHDALKSTVINNTTGATLQDWKADKSHAVLSPKASEAAYKAWKRRRSNRPATPVSASPVVQSPAPSVQLNQLPLTFSSMASFDSQNAGPAYVPMPAEFGAHGLARRTAQPVGEHVSQKVEHDTRQALKRQNEAYAPVEHLLERERRAKTEQGTKVAKLLPEESVPESEAEMDVMVKKEVDM